MNHIHVGLANIYGLSAKDHEFDLFINMTAHLSYLFGWNEQETSEALNDLSECKIEKSKISPEEVRTIWTRLSKRPLSKNIGIDIPSQKIAGDLLVYWKDVAENIGITNPSLSEKFEQSRRDALDGVGYDSTPKTISRAESLPEEIFASLLNGPVIHYLDILYDFEIGQEGSASWRDMFPGASPQRSTMYAHGLLPTIEFYATPKELESFQNISWRNDDKFLSAVFSGVNLEFGFIWEYEGTWQSFRVAVAGLNGRSTLGVAMALGMIRVNFFDTSRTPMRHIFSRTLFVSAEQCSRFFEAELHNSISNEVAPPPSSDFHSIDQTRHAGIVPLSHLLRQELPCDLMIQEAVVTYDRLFDEWRTKVRTGFGNSAPPPPPEVLTNLVQGVSAVNSHESLRSGEVFLHIEYDERRHEIEFVWMDDHGRYFDYCTNIHSAFGTSLEKHREHRQGVEGISTSVISPAGEKTLSDLFELLREPFENWKGELGDQPTRIWYSSGRQLSGAPLQFLLSVVCNTEVVRSPSLHLSNLVDKAFREEKRRSFDLVDIFDCSYGESRLNFANRECRAVESSYSNWLRRTAADEFLNSPADIIHISSHGEGFGQTAQNKLLLGEFGDEIVDVVDILRTEGSLKAKLVFLDACSAGSVDHAFTALHEGISVAGATLLRGAEIVVAAEWPIGDFHGALYSSAFHLLYAQGHNAPASLHLVRAYFSGQVRDTYLIRLLDGHLERNFEGWRDTERKLSVSLGDLCYLAAFEIHGRPVAALGDSLIAEDNRIDMIIERSRISKEYIEARMKRDL